MQNANFSGQSKFHTACLYGDMPTIIEEIEKGIDILALNDYKRSALHNCTIGGQLNVAQLLLVDPKVVDQVNLPDVDGNTCVHLAAIHGRTALMALFIDNTADFNKPNNNGLFPVHLAAKRGHWDILRLLYDSQIPLDSKCVEYGRLCIHYAAEAGAEEVVRGLVTLNAVDMADADRFGNLTTHCAAMGNQLKVLRYLVEQGIHVDRISNNLGRYPLHYAAAANATAVVHWILENAKVPDHINVQDKEGLTALHMAGLYGAAAAFNCLKTHGARLELLSREHETPVDAARRAGHPVLIEQALQNKIECSQCKKTRDQDNWRKAHPIPTVMQKIAVDQMRIFRIKGQKDKLFRPLGEPAEQVPSSANSIQATAPLSRERASSAKPRAKASHHSKSSDLVAVGRDLPTKYYGEHIDKKLFKF